MTQKKLTIDKITSDQIKIIEDILKARRRFEEYKVK